MAVRAGFCSGWLRSASRLDDGYSRAHIGFHAPSGDCCQYLVVDKSRSPCCLHSPRFESPKMDAIKPPQGSASRLATFRKMLVRHPRVALIARAARALIHFGPWRSAARWYVRQQRPPAVSGATGFSVIPNLDAAAVAAKIRADSVCVVEPLRRLWSRRSGS